MANPLYTNYNKQNKSKGSTESLLFCCYGNLIVPIKRQMPLFTQIRFDKVQMSTKPNRATKRNVASLLMFIAKHTTDFASDRLKQNNGS